MKTIRRIVFTGGPCSGKTTFMSRAEEVFAERGYRVIVDHESATDLISGGISPATLDMYSFQKYVIDLQLKKEDLCYRAAKEIEGDNVLIFIDRGLLDDKGYVTPEEFSEILGNFDVKEDELFDRYDMVIHLTTSAKGQEDSYGYNNEARYETVDEAIQVDDTILHCWDGHPNRVVIDTEKEFEIKMRKAIQAVFTYLGEDKSVEVFKKYLVEFNDDVLANVKKEKNYTEVHIVQHFLKSIPGFEKRIRRRERNGNTTYYYSENTYSKVNERTKTDKLLSNRGYTDLFKEIDTDLNPIIKDRYSFIYDGMFYRLDVFDFDKTKALLSCQVLEGERAIRIPLYFKVLKEVTDEEKYKNYFLAKSQSFD